MQQKVKFFDKICDTDTLDEEINAIKEKKSYKWVRNVK